MFVACYSIGIRVNYIHRTLINAEIFSSSFYVLFWLHGTQYIFHFWQDKEQTMMCDNLPPLIVVSIVAAPLLSLEYV